MKYLELNRGYTPVARIEKNKTKRYKKERRYSKLFTPCPPTTKTS